VTHQEARAGAGQLEARLTEFTEVLVDIARGTFEATATRSYTGDALDVLAFMLNTTSQEVKGLVEDLRREREQLELAQARMVSAARLAALGQLAGGVAHELNQPLTAIQVVAGMLAEPGGGDIPREEGIELIVEAARRMSRIVDGVRTFARESALRLTPASPATALESALALLREPLRGAGIHVVVEIEPDLPPSSCDVDRLQQVFVNLVANARDALANSRDAVIRVSVRRVGDVIECAVEDNGAGVDASVVDRMFEPFFTTKAIGRGMGLGLGLSQGIVRDHGGELVYDPGHAPGARFVVRLPLSRHETTR
jgi:two-component system, NtrC family, C4-dicarboxylate transport sensor histidine kinase DctB